VSTSYRRTQNRFAAGCRQIEALVAECFRGSTDGVTIRRLDAPHRPNSLPAGCRGLYAFHFAGVWLKIGRASCNTRWQSDHYIGHSKDSALAFSLYRYATLGTLEDERLPGLKRALKGTYELGPWIRQHTDRVEVVMTDAAFICAADDLRALEDLALYRLNPVFEGPWRFGGIPPWNPSQLPR
jgi:hypothetical protein